MKTGRKYLITGLLLCIFYIPLTRAQETCKVLKPEISLNYKGDCKNGLAHGNGEAYGRDQYVGHFKKGYPDGEGTYKWSTGEVYKGHWKRGMRHGMGEFSFFENSRDTTIVGKWDRDEFVGSKTSDAAYQITYKNNINRITVNKIGPGNQIRFKFLRNGNEIAVGNLILFGDSGATRTNRQFTGFENIEFPFEGKLTFTASNDFYGAVLNCELTFIIKEPGSYQIHIFP